MAAITQLVWMVYWQKCTKYEKYAVNLNENIYQWNWKWYVISLLVCDTYGVCCDSEHSLFCRWSTPEAILFSQSFHLCLDPWHRIFPASHKALSFFWYITWYWWLFFFTGTRSTFTGKTWHLVEALRFHQQYEVFHEPNIFLKRTPVRVVKE